MAFLGFAIFLSVLLFGLVLHVTLRQLSLPDRDGLGPGGRAGRAADGASGAAPAGAGLPPVARAASLSGR